MDARPARVVATAPQMPRAKVRWARHTTHRGETASEPLRWWSRSGMDPWLPLPVLAILVSVLDQRQGRHLLVSEQIRRLDLNGFGLAPCGKDHRFVLEHLLIDVERCAQQRANRRQPARLDVWKVPPPLRFVGTPDMTIAHRCFDERHVEATGCRDRHQGVAARDAHRDRLENLA